MGKIQNSFDKMLEETIDDESLVALFCKRMLSNHEIELTSEQMIALRKQIGESLLKENRISIDIEETVGEDHNLEQIQAELESESAWDEFMAGLMVTLQDELTGLMDNSAQQISRLLRQTAPAMLESNREYRNNFEERVVVL